MLNEVFENEFLISVRLAYDMRRYIKSQECITFKFFVFFFNYWKLDVVFKIHIKILYE